jgi:DNA-binding LytR/AlgR family response regulator
MYYGKLKRKVSNMKKMFNKKISFLKKAGSILLSASIAASAVVIPALTASAADVSSFTRVESFDDYIKIYCNNRSKPILSLCSLKKIESVLPASDFIRVHRSYIVRKQSIKMIENRSIVFDKIRIPISKSSLKMLQEYIHICL